MKKLVAGLFAAMMLTCMLSGCGNRTLIDTTYTFKYAIISLPDGRIVEGEVKTWKDYEDGDTIQVTIDDTTYLTHISNVCMMTEIPS